MVQIVLVAQSGPTLCDPKNCSPPGSSVHGILQARILKWIAIPFSRMVQNDTLFLLSKAGFMCTCQDSTLSCESSPSHSSWNEFLEILLLFQLSMAIWRRRGYRLHQNFVQFKWKCVWFWNTQLKVLVSRSLRWFSLT